MTIRISVLSNINKITYIIDTIEKKWQNFWHEKTFRDLVSGLVVLQHQFRRQPKSSGWRHNRAQR